MTTDFLFDPETGDILIEGGELVVGDSTDQHTNDIIVADKGWWKHFPQVGVGLQNYINDVDNLPNLTGAIRVELIADGQNVESVLVEDSGQLTVQTSYPI